VDKVTKKRKKLIKDMIETMYDADGVGLAAPQVGVLKRIVIIDIGDGPIKVINPEVIEAEGAHIDVEGCLSVPNRAGKVERPERIKIRYLNEDWEESILEGTELLAKAICHEIDHLDGILFTDLIIEEDKEKKEK
jgi:peptide deformylase